ncbi:lymphocyte expansion molecule-like [Neodiprion virginianus]|uniref:lymphocyte expansion molecule-like n=1 Tax=Neodiprion virginianus TaxID=2961670 RepID=UPI001EE73505|nr:lymphocyte expansion molecule-like [Neodiprion virginianus]
MPCNRGETSSFKLCRCSCRWRCKCLILRKPKPPPPFGSSVPIGAKIGMHPRLGVKLNDGPPPGTYDPPPLVSKCPVTSWKREEEMKEFAETMGGKLPEKYALQRDLMKRGRGPGVHDIRQWPEVVLEGSCNIRRENTGFGRIPRFKNSRAKETPGPGYTGKEHNPYYHVEKNRFKSFSCLSSFEYDGCLPRFKKSVRSWSIPCNRYNVRHPDSMDSKLKKVTSKRGPYDLFTGPRDASTIFGYLARPKPTDTKNWPTKFPSDFEKAVEGSNRFKGAWTTCPRFTKKPTVRSMLEDISLCYKEPEAPGPGWYTPVHPAELRPERKGVVHPFNDSVKIARPLRPFEISPGPGSYEVISGRKRIPGNGWTFVFSSKLQRSIAPKQDQYNSF